MDYREIEIKYKKLMKENEELKEKIERLKKLYNNTIIHYNKLVSVINNKKFKSNKIKLEKIEVSYE